MSHDHDNEGCSCHGSCGHGDHDHGHEENGCGCDHGSNPWETRSLVVSGGLVALGLAGRWTGLLSSHANIAVCAAAMLAGGWFLLPKAWNSLRRLRPDINLLMVLAVVGAATIGDWAEGASVIFLFGVAEWLEGWADRRSHRAIEALLDLSPRVALVHRDGNFREVPAEEVRVGERITVKSGTGIPLDGVVSSGFSTVNQAPITGESRPVEKRPGDAVFAGTLNHDGSLEVTVTRASGDTTLARIVRLVEEVQERPAPSQRFVDRFARVYTPTVTVLALLVYLVPPLLFGGNWTEWLYRACVLLIIACPCALVISTPVSIVAGLTALARHGVLVKGGKHLEALGRLQAVAFDKTGTITKGAPSVTDVIPLGTHSVKAILGLAASVDDHSPHPVAKAVVAHARSSGVEFERSSHYQNLAGRGAVARIDGHDFFVGNHRLAHELGLCSEALERRISAIEREGRSVVVVGHRPHEACAGELLGLIAIGDAVRAEAAEAIAGLRRAGIRHLVMLSGDNQHTVDAVAARVGIDSAHGDLLPERKLEAVRRLCDQHGFVAMVGDGVNDAPALATATVGVAMGAGGTDAAIETADVTLMKDNLLKLIDAVRLGRRTLGIIRFNIGFALGLKLLFLALAVTGHATLWMAILADTGATLLVTANALRLARD
ncbi:putative cadmium-transporting ATPase [mine drainage metagenome]|uniref:Putative cadmium-transporting ATPase n=1 Tax=mine drainage metagenome TaxID=410659 RepID=A0A1J5SGI0_9ZZZZ